MAHKLTVAKSNAVAVAYVEGDILSPLRKVRAKYLEHARMLARLKYNNDHSANAANSISNLIYQDCDDHCLVCGTIIPPGPDCCSPECDNKLLAVFNSVSVAFPNDEPAFA